MHYALKANKGFTFIELSIVMIVSGLMFVALFKLYDQYLYEEKIRVTKANMTEARAQIAYFKITLNYPCPADRSLSPDDPNYGRQFDPDCNPAAIGLTVGNCTANNGICMVEGARDTDDAGSAPDPVLIGALPVRDMKDTNAIPVSDKIAADAWGNKFTYAVTANLTRGVPENKFYNGVIDAIDENNFPTAGIDQNGHYAIISHGPDGKGAFTQQGIRTVPCGTVAAAKDAENCDDANATFVQALGMSRGANNNYYDDLVYFAISQASALWAYFPNEQHIYNLNTNNVGIGTDAPTERLTVGTPPGGPAGSGNLKTDNNALSSLICNTDGNNCFNIRAITSSGVIRCNSGRVMDGINNGAGDCETPVFSPLTPNVDCGTGWVRGIRSNGEVICWP